MKTRLWTLIGLPLVVLTIVASASFSRGQAGSAAKEGKPFDEVIRQNAEQLVQQGRQIFRFDTFGDEAFWGDTIQLHRAIEGTKFGGVATPDLGIDGVSPATALAVGLKVDLKALPHNLVEALEEGKVDLNDPATTLALLKLNAVIGVTGFFNPDGSLRSMGIQCALCHSIVDQSFTAPGIPPGNIGRRLDGFANRDLNVGVIVSLASSLQPVADLLSLGGTPITVATVKDVLRSWGPGKFDAELFLDEKAFNPNTGQSAATLIPPAFGLAGVNLHTWTGWGSVTHWNAFVANLEMHGKGTFFDPRLNDPVQFPIAAAAGFGNVRSTPDLITSKLAALHFYQLAIPAPTPPEGSFDQVAAVRGEAVFNGPGNCSTCHVPPLYTEPGWNLHTPSEIKIDDFQANRSPAKGYRTSPLKGLFSHVKGGFFHDGRFATLRGVVNHYNDQGLTKEPLTEQQKSDLVEFLKSL